MKPLASMIVSIVLVCVPSPPGGPCAAMHSCTCVSVTRPFSMASSSNVAGALRAMLSAPHVSHSLVERDFNGFLSMRQGGITVQRLAGMPAGWKPALRLAQRPFLFAHILALQSQERAALVFAALIQIEIDRHRQIGAHNQAVAERHAGRVHAFRWDAFETQEKHAALLIVLKANDAAGCVVVFECVHVAGERDLAGGDVLLKISEREAPESRGGFDQRFPAWQRNVSDQPKVVDSVAGFPICQTLGRRGIGNAEDAFARQAGGSEDEID